MVRNVMFVLLVGAILLSGAAFADQPQTTAVKNTDLARAIQYDGSWAVRSGELQKLDTERHPWLSGKGKAQKIDTLLHFTAEGPSWNDQIQGAPWDTVDNTVAAAEDTLWHVDTFNAISGSYSLWWGDPDVGGYLSERLEYIYVPEIVLAADQDSAFLIYKQYVRCEEAHGLGIFEGWDGYNVRVDVSGDAQGYYEIAPYKVTSDSSYYKSPPDAPNEWNILRCWERWGEQFGPYVPPYDQWIGGFANDGTGAGGTETIVTKVFDLRPFAGDTVRIAFAGGSDWGYDTLDDSTLFGYIIDNVLIMDDMDSLKIATLSLTGTQLFFEDFEGGDPGWEHGVPGVPTGNWWYLSAGGHSGIYCAACRDPFTGEYPENCDNVIRSPKLAHDQFSSSMAELDLNWYLKCVTEDDHSNAYNQYKLDDGQWRQISVLTHPLGTSYVYSLSGVDNSTWWSTDQWSSFMHDMTPLVTDSTITWDTLQVQIGFGSDAGWDTTGTIGLQVDDVTLSGRIGAPYDIGVTAMKIPGPNANDVEIVIDSVAIENFGFNVASSGTYQVFMCVLDTTSAGRIAVMDTTQVLDFANAPDIDPLETVMAPLDPDVAKFTMTEKMSYDIKVWTYWPLENPDSTSYNDTLKTEYTAKADYYPGFYNYPAGQGQLRYHDQGFYNYPYINIRVMGTNEIAATHFTPEERFYPFDMRLGLPEIKEINETYNFKVWGSGNTPDEAPLLATIPFTTDNTDQLNFIRIDLDAIDALQHMSSDFWMGVEFPTGSSDYVMGTESAENDAPGRNWGHSYLYNDTTGWAAYDYDWVITAVISFRTVDPNAKPSLSGPPSKNSSGNLYLDWPDVSQAWGYLIYRSAHVESLFDLIDTAFVSNYTDPGVVGTVGSNYYYLFHTVDDSLGVGVGVYDKTSKAVGEFDKALSNVK